MSEFYILEISVFDIYTIKFNLDGDETTKLQFTNIVKQDINKQVEQTRVDSLHQSKENFFTTYGGLFFIGILFLMATVLIIYYKQIS